MVSSPNTQASESHLGDSATNSNQHSRRQYRHWLLTIPYGSWTPDELPGGCCYVRGQREVGTSTAYDHWQVYVVTAKKCRIGFIKSIFGRQCHVEPTRSAAARLYVWKEDTRVEGSQFEFGQLPTRRNCESDWERVWDLAKLGSWEFIEPQIRVQHYRTLRAISADFAQPIAIVRQCIVYWGNTGVGKSRRAWEEAGLDAYPKDPRTKFWCGYKGIFIN